MQGETCRQLKMIVQDDTAVPLLRDGFEQVGVGRLIRLGFSEMEQIHSVIKQPFDKRNLPRQCVRRGDDYPFHKTILFT